MSSGLQVLSDNRGTIVMGSISADVYFIRIVDFVSAGLGMRCGAELRQGLGDAKQVNIFLDVEAAQASEFITRGPIVSALLSQRRHLVSVTILAAPGDVQTKAMEVASMLTTKIEVLHSQAVFKSRMRDAAPTARAKFPASGRIRVALSTRPRAQSVRPGRRSARPPGRSGTDN
jgi:hypothetical protein